MRLERSLFVEKTCLGGNVSHIQCTRPDHDLAIRGIIPPVAAPQNLLLATGAGSRGKRLGRWFNESSGVMGSGKGGVSGRDLFGDKVT